MVPEIRNIEVGYDVVTSVENTELFARFFRGSNMPPEKARDWAGGVSLYFPELEIDGEAILINPLVRQFIKRLYESTRFFLYFADSLEYSGSFLGLTCAYARDEQIEVLESERFRVHADHALNLILARRIADAVIYAHGVKDDWESVLKLWGGNGLQSMARQLLPWRSRA